MLPTVDEAFLASAPSRFVDAIEIALPAERVWAELTAYRRSAENYLVEPLGPDRCRFTWTLAFERTLLGKLNSPLTAPIIKRMFADTRRHFEQLAAAR